MCDYILQKCFESGVQFFPMWFTLHPGHLNSQTMELLYCLGLGSFSETKEPASVVCQLMMILYCDFRRGVILRIKLFVSLVLW